MNASLYYDFITKHNVFELSIYRRRVGKTALINQFIKDKNQIDCSNLVLRINILMHLYKKVIAKYHILIKIKYK